MLGVSEVPFLQNSDKPGDKENLPLQKCGDSGESVCNEGMQVSEGLHTCVVPPNHSSPAEQVEHQDAQLLKIPLLHYSSHQTLQKVHPLESCVIPEQKGTRSPLELTNDQEQCHIWPPVKKEIRIRLGEHFGEFENTPQCQINPSVEHQIKFPMDLQSSSVPDHQIGSPQDQQIYPLVKQEIGLQEKCHLDEREQTIGISFDHQTRATSKHENCGEEPEAIDVLCERETVGAVMSEAEATCLVSKGQEMSEVEEISCMEMSEKEAVATAIALSKEGAEVSMELSDEEEVTREVLRNKACAEMHVSYKTPTNMMAQEAMDVMLQESAADMEPPQEAVEVLEDGGGTRVEVSEETAATDMEMSVGKATFVEVIKEATAVEILQEIAAIREEGASKVESQIMKDTSTISLYSIQLSSAVVQSATQLLSSGNVHNCKHALKIEHASSGSLPVQENLLTAIQESHEKYDETRKSKPVSDKSDSLGSKIAGDNGSDASVISNLNTAEQEEKHVTEVVNLLHSMEGSFKECHDASLQASTLLMTQDNDSKSHPSLNMNCHESQEQPEEFNIDQQLTNMSLCKSKLFDIKQNQSDICGSFLSTEHYPLSEDLENYNDSHDQEGKMKMDTDEHTIAIWKSPGNTNISRNKQVVTENILPSEFPRCSEALFGVNKSECEVAVHSGTPQKIEGVSSNLVKEDATNTVLNENFDCTSMLQVIHGNRKSDGQAYAEVQETEATQKCVCKSMIDEDNIRKHDGTESSGKNAVKEFFEDKVTTTDQIIDGSNIELTDGSLLGTEKTVEKGVSSSSCITSYTQAAESSPDFNDLSLKEEDAEIFGVCPTKDKNTNVCPSKLKSNSVDKNVLNYISQTPQNFKTMDSFSVVKDKVQEVEIRHAEAQESLPHVLGMFMELSLL